VRAGFQVRVPHLAIATLIYLGLPVFIFILGWLRTWIGISAVAILGASFMVLVRKTRGTKSRRVEPASWSSIAAITAIAIVWLYLSGTGGLTPQNYDHHKHNSITADLISRPWPVRYVGFGSTEVRPLVYSIAYYLPASLVGWVLGSSWTNAAQLVVTFLGIMLSLAWFLVLSRKHPRFWTLLSAAFILASGMDIVGYWLTHGFIIPSYMSLEWWTDVFRYNSNTTHLFWGPQHALPGWLATAVILETLDQPAFTFLVFPLAALTLLWSPFVTIGLVPFVLLAVSRGLRPALSRESMVSALLLAFLGAAYFLSSAKAFQSGWIWNVEPSVRIIDWLVFCVLEFGALVALMRLKGLKGDLERNIWLACVLTLTVLPAYKVGRVNDLVMRASIPALFAIWVLCARVFLRKPESPTKRWVTILACLVLALGIPTPIVEITRARGEAPAPVPVPLLSVFGRPFGAQYLGNEDSFFFTRLAKRPSKD
jgi:hypothetical protein